MIRVFRRGGRVLIKGRLQAGRRARVRAYRWKRRAHRFSRKASYRRVIRISKSGRFRHRVRKPALRRGKWLIVVRARYPRVSAASARLR